MSVELARTVLEIAEFRLGIKEVMRNRGPEIDEWLRRVGLDPLRHEYPWCAAFLWCVVDDAASRLRIPNPLPRGAKVMSMWRRSPSRLVSLMPRPGSAFFHATRPNDPESSGHCGFVTGVTGTGIDTIEGNTNAEGSREGDRVARQTRPFAYVNLGYVDLERA